jgi:hypothetical protein
MAKIPVYDEPTLYSRSKAGPARGDMGVVAPVGEKAFGGAVESLGTSTERYALVLQDKQQKIQEQRDYMDVLDAQSRFGDAERVMLSEESARQGREARGAVIRATKWYDAHAKEFQDGLENDRQKLMFARAVTGRRAAGITQMSVHEAKQDRVLKEQVGQEAILESERTVRMAAASGNIREQAISRALATYDDLWADQNNPEFHAEQKLKIEGALRAAALESLVDQNPKMGLDLLEEWKAQLNAVGDDTYDRLKRQLQVEATYLDAKEAHPGDYAEQEAYVAKQGLPDAVMRTVKRRIRDDKTAFNNQEQQFIDDTENAWFDKWTKGELTMREVENAEHMPTARKTSWLSRLRVQRREDDGERRQEWADDNSVLNAEWSMRVDMDPHKYTASDIYADVVSAKNRSGLTASQARVLVDRLAINQLKPGKRDEKAVKEAVKATKKRIKNMYNNGDFGEIHAGKDSGKKNLPAKMAMAEAAMALDDWILDHPNEDPTEWFESYMDLQAAERATMELDTLLETLIPGGPNKNKRLKKIASGEKDDSIVMRMLKERGYDATQVTDEQMKRIKNTQEFFQYKIRMLNE